MPELDVDVAVAGKQADAFRRGDAQARDDAAQPFDAAQVLRVGRRIARIEIDYGLRFAMQPSASKKASEVEFTHGRGF